MVAPLVAAAGIGAGASLAGSAMGAFQANRNHQLNKQALAHQMHMDKHGAQVRKQDLIAAGINPILAAGDAASGHASMGGGLTGGGAELAGAGNTAASMMRAAKENETMDSQIGLNEAGTAKGMAEASESAARAGVAEAQQRQVELQNAVIEINNPAVSAEATARIAEAKMREARAEYERIRAENGQAAADSWWGKYVHPYLDDAGKLTGAVGNVVGAGTNIHRAGSARQASGAMERSSHYQHGRSIYVNQ